MKSASILLKRRQKKKKQKRNNGIKAGDSTFAFIFVINFVNGYTVLF